MSSEKITSHSETENPSKVWVETKVHLNKKKVAPLPWDAPPPDDKIRFVCISDTHSTEKRWAAEDFVVPPGDVLLHAGDFTKIGSAKEINEFNQFLASLPHRHKIVVAGNHELCLRHNRDKKQDDTRRFFETLASRTSPSSATPTPEKPDSTTTDPRSLFTNCIYLEDSGVEIGGGIEENHGEEEEGIGGAKCGQKNDGIKIWGSPWQPEFRGWAFNLQRGDKILEKWNLIPSDTDILITHGPPLGFGDKLTSGARVGCVELLATVRQRVRPRLHVFGHIHDNPGQWTDGATTFVNAAACDRKYRPVQAPVLVDIDVPRGRTKEHVLMTVAEFKG